MKRITLDNFLYISDFELSQYSLLGKLQSYKAEFNNTQVFNAINELNDLLAILKKVVKKKSLLIDMFPYPVKKVDVDKKRLIFENHEMNNNQVEEVFDFMKWAIPQIEDVLEEGLCVKNISESEEIDSISIV